MSKHWDGIMGAKKMPISDFERPYEPEDGDCRTTGFFIRLNGRIYNEGWRSSFRCSPQRLIQRVEKANATTSSSQSLHQPAIASILLGSWNDTETVKTRLCHWQNRFFIYRQLLFTVLCRNGFWVMLNIPSVALSCIVWQYIVNCHLRICRLKTVWVELKQAWILGQKLNLF